MELQTGTYCNATEKDEIDREIQRIYDAAFRAMKTGIKLSARHGLNYKNVISVLFARCLEEVHIGRSIFSRAVDVGLPQAVDEMLEAFVLTGWSEGSAALKGISWFENWLWQFQQSMPVLLPQRN